MVTERMAPQTGRVRAYFAPVARAVGTAAVPTLFDPAQNAGFGLESPPVPWVDLGWIHGFTRISGTVVAAVRAGTPAVTQMQARTEIEAQVRFGFASWGKLQLALAAGTQQMNVLRVATGVAGAGVGGAAVPATPVTAGSTPTVLQVDAGSAAGFAVGGLVAVDVDYLPGTTGFVGSGVSGAYVRTALADVDYVRRVTLNVGRVAAINGGALTLESPLLAGTPTAAMKVSPVVGFCDREGSRFFQEWSGLFVTEGQQGERVVWHYPRLQTMAGIAEESAKAPGGYEALRLAGSFRALAVTDALDGENVVCYRSYVAS